MGSQLAVFLYSLLVVRNCLLSSFYPLLGLPHPGTCHVQLLPELKLSLPGILLQFIIHLIYSFLWDTGGVEQ